MTSLRGENMQLIQQMLPQMIVEDGPHRGEIFTIPMNTQTLFIGREVSFHKNAVSVQGGSRQIKRKRSARERKQNNERKKVRRKGVRSSKRIKKQTSGANTSATATANKDKRGNILFCTTGPSSVTIALLLSLKIF